MNNNILVLIFMAVLPVLLILWYVYKKDRNKEPARLLILLFIMGIASCFLVLAVSDQMEKIIPFFAKDTNNMNFVEILIYCFIGIALVEEFCKWIMVFIFGYKSKHFDEVYDGMVYAVFVSLGFAFFENLIYVLVNDSIGIGLFRGILAVPGHACDAIAMGHFISLAKVASVKENHNEENKYLILSVLVPTVLHGIYDFCLFSKLWLFYIVFLIFIVYLFTISFKRIKKESYENKKFMFNNKFCPVCGTKVVGEFCGSCGRRQD